MFAKLINRVATALVEEFRRLEKQDRENASARQTRLNANPFYKDGSGWNFTEQSRLLVDEPDRARELAAEAGVKVPDGPHERIQLSCTVTPDVWEAMNRDNAPGSSGEAPIVQPPKGWLDVKPKGRRHLRVAKTRSRTRKVA